MDNGKGIGGGGSLVWYRTWGGNYDDQAYSIWGNGSAIYTSGTTNDLGIGEDMVLVKWDASGNQLWNHTWGCGSIDEGRDMWCNSTAIYTCGWTNGAGMGAYDIALVKWDAEGNKIWNHTWGGSGVELGESVWGDGMAVYTCGSTTSFGAGGDDIVLIKWDAAGNQVWNRTWGGILTENAYSVQGDGTSIYVCGNSNSYTNGSAGIVLIKWNAASGTLQWNRTWGGGGGQSGYSVWVDGTGIYVCGIISGFGSGDTDTVLVKWDVEGNYVWNRTWGGIEDDKDFSIWGDGTMMVYTCGFTKSYGAGDCDMQLVMWDTEGNRAWSSLWGGNDT
nr:hypothetical protein [Candidatus Sigynarchaeota archaeon]